MSDFQAPTEVIVCQEFIPSHDIPSDVRIASGGHLTANVPIRGDLFVERGGSAHVNGPVRGAVVNLGGTVELGPRASCLAVVDEAGSTSHIDADATVTFGRLTCDRGQAEVKLAKVLSIKGARR